MKSHPRDCQPLHGDRRFPCTLPHSYQCVGCGTDFAADGTTLQPTQDGYVYPSPFWPFCALKCSVSYRKSHSAYRRPDPVDLAARDTRNPFQEPDSAPKRPLRRKS